MLAPGLIWLVKELLTLFPAYYSVRISMPQLQSMHYNNSLANNIPDILKSYTLYNIDFKSTLTPDIHIISHDPSQPHSGLRPAMWCSGPHQQVGKLLCPLKCQHFLSGFPAPHLISPWLSQQLLTMGGLQDLASDHAVCSSSPHRQVGDLWHRKTVTPA